MRLCVYLFVLVVVVGDGDDGSILATLCLYLNVLHETGCENAHVKWL